MQQKAAKEFFPLSAHLATSSVSRSTTEGFVFGMAQMRVTPPARAAAVPVEKSSLWVAP